MVGGGTGWRAAAAGGNTVNRGSLRPAESMPVTLYPAAH